MTTAIHQLGVRLGLLAAGALALVGIYTGCSDGDRLPPTGGPVVVGGTGGGGPAICQDGDNDSFGANCASGADCDDNDASVTDECYRCNTPNDGCECPSEGQVVSCGSVSSKVGETVTCVVGDRACEGGVWSECRPTSMSTMSVPSSNYRLHQVGTMPSPCVANPCDPFCVHFPSTVTPTTDPNTMVGPGGVELVPTGAGPGDSGPPSSCGMTPQTAQRDPLCMVLMVDKSGSMAGAPWLNVSGAIQTFIADPGLDGMTAGLDFFPSPLDQCNAVQYSGANLSVPLGLLPGVAPAVISQIGAIVPGGSTPTLPAMNGALLDAAVWASGAPDRKCVAVLVTDGLPTDCGNCGGKKGKSAKQETACRVQEVATLVENFFFSSTSIETFVIGVDTGNNLDFLNILARAGSGGARDATIISGSSAGAQAALVDALNAIRDQSLSCDFDVPTPPMGVIDPATTTVSLSGTAIPKVTSLGACGAGDGFVFDTNGPKIVLCPTTCSTAKADLTASIEIVYGCRDSCSSGSNRADPGPLDMFVMMDRSGSMGTEVDGVTRWQGATVALRNFIRNSESVGMGFGISYFPVPNGCQTCGVDSSCGLFCSQWDPTPWPFCPDPRTSGAYGDCVGADGAFGSYEYYASSLTQCTPSGYVNFAATAGVDYDILPGAADAHVNNVMGSLAKVIPSGATPTEPSLQGAIDHALARAPTVPDRKQIVVLVTDGQPSNTAAGCNSDVPGTAAIAGAGYAAGIDTFVIGITDNPTSLANLDTIAQAGSGNQFNAFIVDTGNPAGFIDALTAIRQRSLNCAFALPTPPAMGMIDINSPQILVTAGTPAVEVSLTKVNDATLCAGLEWYYDDNVNPTTVNLCPAACSLVQNDTSSGVDILYQCVQNNTLMAGSAIFEYDAATACGSAQQPVWGDWSWTTMTPSDTNISFTVATGDRDSMGNVTNLSAEVPLEFTNALAANQACASLPNICNAGIGTDTQVGGPLNFQPGDAVVDTTLANAGIPRNGNYLRIRATLNPSSDMMQGPTLSDWDLQLTCEFSE